VGRALRALQGEPAMLFRGEKKFRLLLIVLRTLQVNGIL
jgi:hypothetical protein